MMQIDKFILYFVSAILEFDWFLHALLVCLYNG